MTGERALEPFSIVVEVPERYRTRRGGRLSPVHRLPHIARALIKRRVEVWISNHRSVAGILAYVWRPGALVGAWETVERHARIAQVRELICTAGGKECRRERVAARSGWQAIPAVHDGELHEIKSPIILQPGPGALVPGLAALHAIIASWVARNTPSEAGVSHRMPSNREEV